MNRFSDCLRQVLEESARQVAHEASMQNLEKAFQELQASIRIPLSKDLAADLVESSVRCYDVSFKLLEMHLKSNNKFILEFVLRLRLVGIDSIVLVLTGLDKQSTVSLLTKDLLEKLVVTARLALNNGPAYASRAKPINRLADQILPEIQKVPARVLFLHHLNCCEYYRYECQLPNFSPNDLRQAVESLKKVDFNGANPRDVKYLMDYQPLLDSVLMEICTKLLKKRVDISALLDYLPEAYKTPLLALYRPTSHSNTIANFPGVSTAYYSLYLEVRDHGLERIDINILREILNKNWQERGFFEIIYVRIKQCLCVLSLWFEVYMEKGSSPFITEGYRMFVAAANNFLTVTGNNPQNMIELTLSVCRSFSAGKKKSNEEIIPPLKKCMMVLVELLSQQYNDELKIMQLFEELTNVIKRIRFFEHHKDLQKLVCFYLLVRKSPFAEQCYREYLSGAKSKNEGDIIMLLHRCMNSSGSERTANINELVKSKSAAVPIFLVSQPEAILELPEDCLVSFKEPISYYCMIFSKQLSDEDFGKALKHLHNSLERIDIRHSGEYLKNIRQLILHRIKNSHLGVEVEYKAVLVCLYCEVVVMLKDELPYNNMSPNQFYRLNMWLGCLANKATISQEFVTLGSLLVFKSLQKYLSEREARGRVTLTVGEFDCLSKLFELVVKHCPENSHQLNAVKFSMLQILILSESVPINDIKKIVCAENSKQQLQLYNTIEFMPEDVRAAVLRKIVLLSMQSNERAELNPDDLKKLILMTNQKKERLVYIRELLLTGDPECQSFVEILASMYPEVADALMEESGSLL